MTLLTIADAEAWNASASAGGSPVLDLVVPVYNEAATLEANIRRAHKFLHEEFPLAARLTIADNASNDGTTEIARRLAADLPDVRAVALSEKGRGRALKAAWGTSDATVLAYMDVDLSTDLRALMPLIAPLLSGHSDLAIGSRLATGSHVVRGPKRELISRCYNRILRSTLHVKFTDAQCGFKAIRRDRAKMLLPLVRDGEWFFDTELLVLAERAGLRIHEVPVDWVDDPDSRVDIVATATADLKGVVRMVRSFATGTIPLEALRERTGATAPLGRWLQLVRFAIIGALSTAAYLLGFALLSPRLGSLPANAVALVTTCIANTAANRRWTFRQRSHDGHFRQQLQGLLIMLTSLGLTSGAILALHFLYPTAGHTTTLIALVIANAIATVLRFGAFRSWVFRQPTATTGSH